MSTVTTEYRAVVPRSVWMRARGRNAARRLAFIGAVGIGTFVVALVALVITPQQAQRAAKAMMPRPSEYPDTATPLARIAAARTRIETAEHGLALARGRQARLAAMALDTLSPEASARRDSVGSAIAALDQLLARVQNAPLTTSYRALAESPELAGQPRVHALLDSLAGLDREREAFGAAGGADPMFVALTTRANEVGREIQAIGVERRATLAQQQQALAPPVRAPTLAEVAAADTTIPIALRDSGVVEMRAALADLDAAHRRVRDLDVRADRAREIATVSAPPLALLGAAAVLGLVLGFGSALIDEIRHPRVADAHEAERIAGVRVLGVAEPRQLPPERSRRQADRLAPPYLDPRAPGHQLVYLHAAAASAPGSLLMLTVTGDDAAVAAVVASNFAAIAAEEARNTLIVDVNTEASAVSAALRVRAEPGVVELIDGAAEWPEVTVQATIGRDRTIDVVPSGIGVPAPEPSEIKALLRRDAARLARHYDTIIVVASEAQAMAGVAGVLPKPDVIYCARIGHTRLNALSRAVDAAGEAGGRMLGIVLWNAEPPALPTPQELAAGRRPQRTSEFETVSVSG